MKTLNFTIGLTIIILIAYAQILWAQGTQNRNVIWVHGLDGTEESWKHYEDLFTRERQIKSLRKTYNSHNGLNAAAQEVQVIVDVHLGADAYNARNLAIGHSMGGVVIRNIDRLTQPYNKRFGGLITVASPNSGAFIANSLTEGRVHQAATHAVGQLSAGPYWSLFPATWLIGGLVYQTFSFTPENIGNLLVTNNQVQNLIGSPTSNADLRVGSEAMNKINAHAASIPRISIWANENSPVHWRMFSTQMFENDFALVWRMHLARTAYHNLYIGYNALGTASALLGFLNPLNFVMAAHHFFLANEWKKGSDWFDKSEGIWCSLNGSSRLEQLHFNSCTYTCIPHWENEWKATRPECHQWEWVCTPDYAWVPVVLPSDGLISRSSQIITGLPLGNVYEVQGANHLEVRNMSQSSGGDNTKSEFNKIWVREDWFKTLPRPQ